MGQRTGLGICGGLLRPRKLKRASGLVDEKSVCQKMTKLIANKGHRAIIAYPCFKFPLRTMYHPGEPRGKGVQIKLLTLINLMCAISWFLEGMLQKRRFFKSTMIDFLYLIEN